MKKNLFHIMILTLAFLLASSTSLYAQSCGKTKTPACGSCEVSAKQVKMNHPEDCACDNCATAATEMSHPADCKCADCALVKSASDKTKMAEGNVWQTKDGQKHYTCPVMGNSGTVANAQGYSIVDKVKYYHCCSACQAPFRADPGKYLKQMALPGNIISVDAKGEKHFRDPVNSTKSIVNNKTKFVDQDGKRYYFSDKKSLKKFKKNPADYIS